MKLSHGNVNMEHNRSQYEHEHLHKVSKSDLEEERSSAIGHTEYLWQ